MYKRTFETFEAIISQADMVLRLRKALIEAEEALAKFEDERIKYSNLITNQQSALAQARGDLAREEARLVEAICAKPITPTILKHVKRVPYPNARIGNMVWMGRRKQLGIVNKKGYVKTDMGVFKCSKKDMWYPYPGESWSSK